jgi:hypothetical protein
MTHIVVETVKRRMRDVVGECKVILVSDNDAMKIKPCIVNRASRGDMSSHLYPPVKVISIYWSGGWLSLNVVMKRKFLPCRESNPGCPVVTNHFGDRAVWIHEDTVRKSVRSNTEVEGTVAMYE